MPELTRAAATAYLDNVPAITLLNPWAHAITHLGKDVENRGWPAPDVVRRILIHAGKGWDEHCDLDVDDVTTSAIVAVADVVGMCGRARRGVACSCGRWARPDQFHWYLGNVLVLPEPVDGVSGARRLWYPQPGVVTRVARQVLMAWSLAAAPGVAGRAVVSS